MVAYDRRKIFGLEVFVPQRWRSARTRAQLVAGRVDWYRITNAAGDTAEVSIYDEIGFFGTTASEFVDELKAITAPNINLRLNTPGGEVFDGIAIHNALREHVARVTVQVDALAASIGSVIAMAGDRVVMGRGAQMMIHDALGLTIGNAQDHREMVDLLDKASDNIAGFYAARAGGDVATWRERMQAETWYTADEAVTAGLADETVDKPADPAPSPTAASWDLSIFRYQGRDRAPAPDLDAATARPSTDPPDTGPGTAAAPEPAAVPDLSALREALKGALR